MSSPIKAVRVCCVSPFTIGCKVMLLTDRQLTGRREVIVGEVGPTTHDYIETAIWQADVRAAKLLGKLFAEQIGVPCEIQALSKAEVNALIKNARIMKRRLKAKGGE